MANSPSSHSSSDSPFSDYGFLSLPDLSTLRHPPASHQFTSVPISPDASERVVVVALSRILGAYCGATDVLLGCHLRGLSPINGRAITAVRVTWTDAIKYDDVLNNLIFRETDDDPSSIRSTLGIQLDDGLQPFLAIFTSNIEYDHPLVVSLETNKNDDGLHQTLRIKYSNLRFHQSSAQLLANQVAALAAAIARDPDVPPKALNFLPDDLLSVVPTRLEDTLYTHYPGVRDIIEFVKRHNPATVTIEYYPDLHLDDSDAVERSVQYLTYGELDTRSNRFAAYLLAQGLELEDRVTLCMPRGIHFHIAMMGVLKAGGCYVPIDPELPEERQKFIIDDSGSRFSLTADNIEKHIIASETYPDDDINNTRPEGLAYLLYTSGTTGKPKGCLLTHDGFAQAIHALSWFANQAGPNKRRWPQLGRYLCVASVAFDVHLAEIFVALSLGMTIICAPRSQLFEDLPYWINRLHISHVGIVPSLIEATMHAVAASVELADDNNGDGKNSQAMELAYIASGGEKMSDAILDKWADSPLVTLANFYGPSETTIGCSSRLMTSQTRKENIGRIFDSCSAYVVDENLKPVVRGGVGELLVGGRLVGRGYHNRPDLTAKAFIEFSHGSYHERVYRTGDLVRLMPDDTMEILGRIDTQIKLRGVRIESEGVSSVIRNAAARFPGLRSNTVLDVSTILTRHPQLKTDQLVSFIGLDSSASIAHRRSAKPRIFDDVPRGLMRALKEACSRELASYMRPAHIVPLDFLPLNQNGKTDNKILATFFQSESIEALGRAGTQRSSDKVNGAESSRALNQAETRIAEIISRYTKVDLAHLSPSSNLFHLGFDSVEFVKFASELRSLNNSKSLSVGTIIQHPTIAGITTLLESQRRFKQEKLNRSFVDDFSQQWRSEVEEAYGAEKIESILPTFPVQDGVLYRSADLKTLYIQHVMLQIHGDVDIEKLRCAWTALMAQREILRTVFHYSSSLVQVVLRPEACPLPWFERQTHADTVQDFKSSFFEGDALDLARSINEDISGSPGFRLALYRIEGQATSILAFSLHHAIYDGISLPLLLQDLEALYLHRTPRSSARLRQVLDEVYDVDMDEAASFWKETFTGFDWSKIPRRLASGETANILCKTFRAGLSQWEHDCAEVNVSLQAVLTAAFGLCLGRQLYGAPDVVFGVIRSGRSFADEILNEARAPLLTVVPTRVNAELGAELLQKVQRDIGAVLVFEHIPLSRVQTWVKPGRALFEVLFSVSIDEGESMELWDILESKQPGADYILAVEVVLDKKKGQIRVDCGFTEPLAPHDVSSILEELETIARALLEGSIGEYQGRTNIVNSYEQTLEEDSDDVEDIPDGPVDRQIEDKIRSVVSHFLKVEPRQISETSSLIAFGLDSIKSVALSRGLRKEGIEIRSLDIMRHPTIRYMTALSTRALNSQESRNEQQEQGQLLAEKRAKIVSSIDAKLLRLEEKDEVQLYPTTILQAGMLSQTISSGGELYVHAFPYRLGTTVDTNLLRTAWGRTVDYFSSLRTSFHFVENLGAWIQAVHSAYPLHWEEVNVPLGKSALVMSEEYIKELDLSSVRKLAEPPVYVRILHQREEDSSTFLLVIHHALYDGISMARLSDVVWRFYRDEQPAPSTQFVDLLGYFEYQEAYGTEFWERQLRDFKRPTLSRRIISPSQVASVSKSAEISVTSARMSKASQHFEVTAQCFGQAAFAIALAKLYNQRDLVYGHVVSGRSVPQAEDVLGPMISTLPVRSIIPAEVRNLDFVRLIHRQNMATQRWQHASLRSIHRKTGLSSLWDAIFLFQPVLDDASDGEFKLWSFDESEDEIAKIQYPLNIELHQHHSHLDIKAAGQSDFFDKDGLDAIVKDFAETFSRIVNEPLGHALPHIDNDDVRAALVNGNGHYNERPASREFGIVDARVTRFIAVVSACIEAPVHSILPDTPLVSLGVDSITAIQISSRARVAGLQLHAADVLRCQAPEDVVQILESKAQLNGTEARPEVRLPSQLKETLVQRLGTSMDQIEGILPASAGMEWLIAVWQQSNRERFQHVFVFELPSDVDEERLKSSWVSLVQKHAILRSTFVSTTGREVNIVSFKKLPEERLWSRRDFSSRQLTVEDIAREMVSKPLSTDLPPCGAVLARLRESRLLVLRLHHFQYDAWSLRLLVNDLKRLYRGKETVYNGSLSSFLENCNSQYFKEEQSHYWKGYLSSPFQPSLFPKRTTNSEDRCDRLFYLDRQALRNVSRFRQRAQELSTTLNVLFLASWARVQAEYSEARSATFGLWHLGRSGVVDDIDALPIPCMNVLPMHVSDTDASLPDLAGRIQKALRQRTAIVEQSHLLDVDYWTAGDGKRLMMNVFVNVVATAELQDGYSDDFLRLIDLPFFIPRIEEIEERASAEKLAICNLIEDAVLVDFVVERENVVMSIEYRSDYLDEERSRTLVTEWARVMEETLAG